MLMHNWLCTGAQHAKFYENAVDGCPMCGTITETQLYLFQYAHRDEQSAKTLPLTQFRSTLLELKTAPIIIKDHGFKVAKWINATLAEFQKNI